VSRCPVAQLVAAPALVVHVHIIDAPRNTKRHYIQQDGVAREQPGLRRQKPPSDISFMIGSSQSRGQHNPRKALKQSVEQASLKADGTTCTTSTFVDPTPRDKRRNRREQRMNNRMGAQRSPGDILRNVPVHQLGRPRMCGFIAGRTFGARHHSGTVK
jgi:hypothetical protein